MNAAAPMMGGMSCPPVEAAASTAPANSGRYPSRFIMGMVRLPESTMLETELPTRPSRALVMTAILAGPPEAHPATAFQMSMKSLPDPRVFTKRGEQEEQEHERGRDPQRDAEDALGGENMWDAMRSSEYPRCDMKPGKYAPK